MTSTHHQTPYTEGQRVRVTRNGATTTARVTLNHQTTTHMNVHFDSRPGDRSYPVKRNEITPLTPDEALHAEREYDHRLALAEHYNREMKKLMASMPEGGAGPTFLEFCERFIA
ncbi:hypothetical protein [Streptomyces sp. NPDC058084]|uniref:hypothetical protein n=1 Tax=Streptomyces sp. NPDC058084 TaxID=3346333 RepID=UPI0036EA7786